MGIGLDERSVPRLGELEGSWAPDCRKDGKSDHCSRDTIQNLPSPAVRGLGAARFSDSSSAPGGATDGAGSSIGRRGVAGQPGDPCLLGGSARPSGEVHQQRTAWVEWTCTGPVLPELNCLGSLCLAAASDSASRLHAPTSVPRPRSGPSAGITSSQVPSSQAVGMDSPYTRHSQPRQFSSVRRLGLARERHIARRQARWADT